MEVAQIAGYCFPKAEIPAPTQRVQMVFNEFLRRHMELERIRKREWTWLANLILWGGSLFLIPIYSGDLGLVAVFLVLFAVSLAFYIHTNRQVEHLKVNVAILQHHLIGLLEVGFCDHITVCGCAEKFRYEVWKKYHISLY